MGAVLHTLNIRLFAEQLVYIVNEAEDKVIFVDGDLVPLLERLADQLPSVKLYVIMGEAPYATGKLQPSVDYETFIADQPDTYRLAELDENAAAAMCYTSGTTGNPKGVVYSHRSIFLHSMGVGWSIAIGMSEQDIVLPIVPMFHANAWGFLHAAVMWGQNCLTWTFHGPAAYRTADGARACDFGRRRADDLDWPVEFVRQGTV